MPEKAKFCGNCGTLLAVQAPSPSQIPSTQKTMKINPLDARSLWTRGENLERKGDYWSAIECYQDALKIEPNNKDLWYVKAICEARIAKSRDAIQSLRKYLELAPEEESEKITYAKKRMEQLEENSKFADALRNTALEGERIEEEEYERIRREIIERQLRRKRSAEEAFALVQRGESAFNESKFEEAIQYYDQAWETNPSPKAMESKARVLEHMGKLQEAIDCLNKASRLYSADYSPIQSQALTLSYKGFMLCETGRIDEAIESLVLALKIYLLQKEAWCNAGTDIESSGLFERVLESLNRILEINPLHSTALNLEGYLFSITNRNREAIHCFDNAIKINSRDTFSYSCKGTALANLGDYEAAITCYEELLKIDPQDKEVWRNKASSEQKIGRTAKATHSFQEYLRLKESEETASRQESEKAQEMSNRIKESLDEELLKKKKSDA